MNNLLQNHLEALKYKIQEELVDKKNFRHHQQRDLTSCWPAERNGREQELIELEKDIEELEDTLSQLDNILKIS